MRRKTQMSSWLALVLLAIVAVFLVLGVISWLTGL